MTESEWLDCQEPSILLRHQRHLLDGHLPNDWSQRNASTPRKWRLFGCACARRIWNWLDHPAQQIIGTTERLGETELGFVDRGEFQQSLRAWHHKMQCGHDAANAVLLPSSGIDMVAIGAGHARRVIAGKIAAKGDRKARQANLRSALDQEAAVQSDLIRCVFGNSFRSVASRPELVKLTVKSLAQAAYEERALPSGELDTVRLSILADALEEAGCDSADILTHLRGPGPHVRGCWVVDLLLGKV